VNDRLAVFSGMVSAMPYPHAQPLPLLIRPAQAVPDAVDWARRDRLAIRMALLDCGAILFRGFGLDTAERINAFAAAISPDMPAFAEESSPRSRIAGAVHTSTDYPHEYPIQFHNEYSYASEWPMKLYFGCLVAPAAAGETPIADTRGVLRRLRPATRDAFRARGVRYTRNFRRGVGVSWQTAFGSEDRSAVEAHCRQAGIAFEWLAGDALRTRQTGEAIVRHPDTGEELWFNHGFFFNLEALEPPEVREFFRAEGEDALSTQTSFADGTPIPLAMLDDIRAAYEAEAIRIPWQRGDVLLIDNMLTSHGRSPFSGERRIVVVMAEKGRRGGP
jgi:alpha-ketoglutarate-dependent taurine dioxygenase